MATDQPTWTPPVDQPRPAAPLRLPNPAAAAALRLVGTIGVLVLIALGAVATVVHFFQQQAVETLPLAPGVTRLVLGTDTGDIRVRAAVGSEVPRLTSTLHWAVTRPQVQRTVSGDTEQFDARCQRDWLLSSCAVDLDLVVPAGATLKIDTDTGDVRVSGTTGDLDTTTSTGDVRLSAVSGTDLTVRTDTGDITVVAAGADATMKADSDTGDIRLTMTAAPRSVQARADVGDITITVPPGADYAVSGSSDVGERTVSVPTDPAAGRSISAETSVGDVRVLAGGQ